MRLIILTLSCARFRLMIIINDYYYCCGNYYKYDKHALMFYIIRIITLLILSLILLTLSCARSKINECVF